MDFWLFFSYKLWEPEKLRNCLINCEFAIVVDDRKQFKAIRTSLPVVYFYRHLCAGWLISGSVSTPCSSSPCLNGGTCLVYDFSATNLQYVCQCPLGYTGTNCQQRLTTSPTFTESTTSMSTTTFPRMGLYVANFMFLLSFSLDFKHLIIYLLIYLFAFIVDVQRVCLWIFVTGASTCSFVNPCTSVYLVSEEGFMEWTSERQREVPG